MRMSTKSRFAVTAMIDIALRGHAGPVSLADIGARHQMSVSYLEQLFSKLRLNGLVTSIRGPGGGYALNRRIDAITVADIISAVEEVTPIAKLTDPSPVQDTTQDLWDAMNDKVLNFMQSVTLKSLVLDQLALGVQIELKPSPTRGVFKKPIDQPICNNVPNSVFALSRTLHVPPYVPPFTITSKP